MKNVLLIILFLLTFGGVAQKSMNEKQRLEFDSNFFDAMNERLKSNYDKSNEYFEQCLAIDNHNDAIYFKMAQNSLDAKKYEEALQFLEQARRLNPENKWYQKLYIDIKIAEGAPRDEIKKLIKDFEATAQNKYLIRSLYRKMYRIKARFTYPKQAKPKKQEDGKKGELARLWQEKKYAELIQAGEKQLDEQPDNPQIYLYVAQAYKAMSKPKKSLEFLEMGMDFILRDKSMKKAYYQEFIKVYQQLNKPKKVKLYQQKLQKI